MVSSFGGSVNALGKPKVQSSDFYIGNGTAPHWLKIRPVLIRGIVGRSNNSQSRKSARRNGHGDIADSALSSLGFSHEEKTCVF